MIAKKVIANNEPLTVKDFTKGKLVTEILEAPKLIKTKFSDDQVLIVVKVGIDKRSWFCNWTSMNHLIDQWGNDEEKMIGKELNLSLVNQAIQGKMKEIIYLDGSLKP